VATTENEINVPAMLLDRATKLWSERSRIQVTDDSGRVNKAAADRCERLFEQVRELLHEWQDITGGSDSDRAKAWQEIDQRSKSTP
jgi:hypothetical protein